MQLNIQKLDGYWTEGFALDLHTTSSKPIVQKYTTKKIIDGKETDVTEEIFTGSFDTKRPEIAELLYQLKYHQEKKHIKAIAAEAALFLKETSKWKIDKIVPIPPSDTTRSFQPVYKLAKRIGKMCNLKVDFDTLKKLKSTGQLKSIDDPVERRETLKDVFDIELNILNGKNILLFDDLFRSGETLNAASDVIKNRGGASNVYVLTITKTRSKR